MGEPRISVVMSICRPGGMDLARMSLDCQTFRDFDFVLVDRFYEIRADILPAYFQGYTFTHVPPKLRTEYIDSGAAWNTGFRLARGELICMMGDYTYYPPTWLEEHWRVHEEFGGKASLVGERTRVHTPATVPDEELAGAPISIFMQQMATELIKWLPVSRFEPLKIRRLRPLGDGRWEVSWKSFLLSANESLPRKLLLKLGGLDEAYDMRSWGFQDSDLGLRAQAVGHRFIYDPRASRPIRIEVKHFLSPVERPELPNLPILLDRIKALEERRLDVVCQGIARTKRKVVPRAQRRWIEQARVLLISPQIYTCGGDMRYQGIERLVWLTARGLLRRGAEVYVAAPRGSCFPQGIQHIDTGPCGDFVQGEIAAYGLYRFLLDKPDAILDYTHSHFAMRELDLPAICWAWHDPAIMQPPFPGYNVCALSEWQRVRLWAHQRVDARVLDCHTADTEIYRPGDGVVDRVCALSNLNPNKGLLETVKLCKKMGQPIDIMAGPGGSPEYTEAVRAECDGRDRVLLGGVSELPKVEILRRSKALVYTPAYPLGTGEAHSHKTVEALCCGTPFVGCRQGAIDEVVEHGVDGYLAGSGGELEECLAQVKGLDRARIARRARERWSVESTVDRLVLVMQQVAEGLRWR